VDVTFLVVLRSQARLKKGKDIHRFRRFSQMDAPYDLIGTLGFPEEGKFNCSDLAAWSVGIPVDGKAAADVLHPAEMSQYGTVLFDSDRRDPKQVPPAGRDLIDRKTSNKPGDHSPDGRRCPGLFHPLPGLPQRPR
jgi:hypothetical protein